MRYRTEPQNDLEIYCALCEKPVWAELQRFQSNGIEWWNIVCNECNSVILAGRAVDCRRAILQRSEIYPNSRIVTAVDE